MPKHHTQVIPREVNVAIEEVTRAILQVLADAGINISAPNTPEGRAQFMKQLAAEGIEIERVMAADRPKESGTRILKNGIQIGFIPTLGVVGGGKRILV